MGSVRNLPSPKAQVSRRGTRRFQGYVATRSAGSLSIKLSSCCDTFLCPCGGPYSSSHATSHRKPSAPVIRNVDCQPYLVASHGTVRGATTAPIFDPELKIPVACARSLRGNHSATVLMQAGKFADSPNPSRVRATPNVNALVAHACIMAAP